MSLSRIKPLTFHLPLSYSFFIFSSNTVRNNNTTSKITTKQLEKFYQQNMELIICIYT